MTMSVVVIFDTLRVLDIECRRHASARYRLLLPLYNDADLCAKQQAQPDNSQDTTSVEEEKYILMTK